VNGGRNTILLNKKWVQHLCDSHIFKSTSDVSHLNAVYQFIFFGENKTLLGTNE
jgi:hypothetical protein